MSVESDQDLLHAYVRARREDAFEKLVLRHLDWVYSGAVRVVRDRSLAEDVTQRVFLALVQHANRLKDRPALTGWLYETTRNFAISTIRSEERRRRRELEAATMQPSETVDRDDLWREVEPRLDDVLGDLESGEREVVVFRYFERLTAVQIGERLGISAEAAQKRIARAIERMRGLFQKRGLSTSTTTLSTTLASHAVQSAPAGLAAAAVANAASALPTLPVLAGLSIAMTSTKSIIGLTAAVLVTATLPWIAEHRKTSALTVEIGDLRREHAELQDLKGVVQRLTEELQTAFRQRDESRLEIARLKNDLGLLKAERRQMASAASPPPSGVASQAPEPSVAAEEPLITADQWRDVGRATPASAFQTLEWAKAMGDTNSIANGLAWADERSRSDIEALFAAAPESVRAAYGSADAYVLSLFGRSGPVDASRRVDAYRILEEQLRGEEALLQVELHFGDGRSVTVPQRYVRVENEWRQALEFGEPEQQKLGEALGHADR